MNVLSVVAGLPTDARWERIEKIKDILESNGHNVNFIHQLAQYHQTGKITYPSEYDPQKHEIYKKGAVGTLNQQIKTRICKNYDVIYANEHAGMFLSLPISIASDVPVVFDMHGSLPYESLLINDGVFDKYGNFTKWWVIEKINNLFSDILICVSKSMARQYGSNTYTVTNGVELKEYETDSNVRDEYRSKLNINSELVVGYIGGTQNWQGVDNFVSAAEYAPNNVKFLFVGANKNKEDNNIIFKKKVDKSDVPAYYAVCDILALPRPETRATHVAAPTKLSEYAASGTPILSTNVGDAANLIKKYNSGVVVPDNSPSSLLTGIEKMYTERDLDKLGKNAHIMAKKELSITKMRQDLLSAIEPIED